MLQDQENLPFLHFFYSSQVKSQLQWWYIKFSSRHLVQEFGYLHTLAIFQPYRLSSSLLLKLSSYTKVYTKSNEWYLIWRWRSGSFLFSEFSGKTDAWRTFKIFTSGRVVSRPGRMFWWWKKVFFSQGVTSGFLCTFLKLTDDFILPCWIKKNLRPNYVLLLIT